MNQTKLRESEKTFLKHNSLHSSNTW